MITRLADAIDRPERAASRLAKQVLFLNIVFGCFTIAGTVLAVAHWLTVQQVISRNPNVLGGTPVFAGTRVPVESFFDCLKHCRTSDYFLEQFPTVKREQVLGLRDDAKKKAVEQQVPA